jgi:peptidoglycan/LPS O-acetylase OafA/YrhL
VVLDVIRVMAAQAVLVGHLWSGLNLVPELRPPNMVYIQNVAVVVFFLLSGFLITYTIHSRKSAGGFSFGEYAVDRFSRIYSALIPSLVLIAVIDGAVNYYGSYRYVGGYSSLDFIGNVLMLQDYPVIGPAAGITSFGSARVLWTLAIEWWLYMAFGWLALHARKDLRFWIFLAVFLPVPLFNLVGGRGNGLTAMWLLGFGGYLALRSGSLRSLSTETALGISALFVLLAAYRLHLTKEAYDVLFAGLSVISLVSFLHVLDKSKLTVPRYVQNCVRYIANYSFTLYLVHLSIAEFMYSFLPAEGWTLFWSAFFLANFAAALLAHVTEMRHRRLSTFLKTVVVNRPGSGGWERV